MTSPRRGLRAFTLLLLLLLASGPAAGRPVEVAASTKPVPPPPDYSPPPLEAPRSWDAAAVPPDPLDAAAAAAAAAAGSATRAPDPLSGRHFGGVFEFCEWFVVFLLIAPGTFPALGCLFLSCAQFLRRRAGIPIAPDDPAYTKIPKELKELESDDDMKLMYLEKAP